MFIYHVPQVADHMERQGPISLPNPIISPFSLFLAVLHGQPIFLWMANPQI